MDCSENRSCAVICTYRFLLVAVSYLKYKKRCLRSCGIISQFPVSEFYQTGLEMG